MAVQPRLLLKRAQAVNVSMDPERQRDKRSLASFLSKLFPEITLRGSEETERAASAALLENIDLLHLDSWMLTCTLNSSFHRDNYGKRVTEDRKTAVLCRH